MEMVRLFPDRFFAYANLNPNYLPHSLEEIERCLASGNCVGIKLWVSIRANAKQLDPEIAYLTADQKTETPFARSWQVEDWMPFQLKRLRTHLRERNVGRVTVKKRGSPLVPEELIQDLRLEGEEEKIVFLTQMKGKPIVIFGKPN